MTQDEREQLEVLLRKHLAEQPETARDGAVCPDPGWISAYLEGELSQALKTSLESHISECRRCQEEFAFLLKIFPGEPVKHEERAQQSKNSVLEWLSLGWLKPASLKPVFAILVVAVVSGVVGYKIIFEQKRGDDKATQIADAIVKPAEPSVQNQNETADREAGTRMNDRPALDSTQPKGRPSSVAEKPRSNQSPRSANEERRYEAPHEAQSALSKDDARNKRTEVFREETNQLLKEKKPQRKDTNNQPTAALQVATAPAPPPPAGAPALNQAMVERDSGAKEQQSLQDKKVAGQLLAGKEATGQLSGSAAMVKRAMTAKQKDSVLDKEVLASKAEESKRALSSAEAIGSSSVQPGQIKLSGKTFELRQNVWVDLAIGKEGEYAPIVIRQGSSEYLDLEKELSIYQDVLNRPEDCLIKLNEHVYRIQKK